MRARNYCAHHNIRDHWTLRCMNRCPDLVVCLKRDLQCLRPEASLVLIYRPNVAGMKGRVDLAQPVNRTPDLCPTENSLAVLNHKILEANSQVLNVKLGGHQTCLSINRLWHELCDMLPRLVGTTAPGHHDCSIQE
ncbi:uncharacterized protein TNCV_1294861 [Trichonephila clavipes]|nr:uncharacterized protein TNCV_1294861 [Trichonephila clavipes]